MSVWPGPTSVIRWSIRPFTHKNDTASWQTEFWGKWVQGAIASYRYNHDKALYDKISHSIDQIIASQQPDGYMILYSSSRPT